MSVNEIVVEVSVCVSSTIRGNEKLCTVKVRGADRDELDLNRPLGESALHGDRCSVSRNRCVVRCRRGGMCDRAAHASRASCKFRLRGRCLCRHEGSSFSCRHVCQNRLMVISGSLALLKADGVRRTGRKTVSKAVTVIVADQLRLSVDHRDCAFLTGCCACSAAVAFFFINFYDRSFQFKFPFQNV